MDSGERGPSWCTSSNGFGLEGRPWCDFVTARADVIPSSVTRVNHTRELPPLDQAPFYETVEWMTLTADGPHEFFDLELGYSRFL